MKECVLGGNDILANLPTGYGKSLVFQVAPIYHSLLEFSKTGITSANKVLVISPLNAIIGQQKKALGQTALCLHTGDKHDPLIQV